MLIGIMWDILEWDGPGLRAWTLNLNLVPIPQCRYTSLNLAKAFWTVQCSRILRDPLAWMKNMKSKVCCIIPSGPVLAQGYVHFLPLPGANFCVCPQLACLGFLSANFLLPYTAAWERKRWYVSFVIWTHVSRVAPWQGTFWRTLYQLSYRTSANLFTFNWDPGGVLDSCTGGFRPQGPGFISSYVDYFREIAIFKIFKDSKFRKKLDA